MAFPTIALNSGTGSDTAASGAGPTTALFGTAGAMAASTVVTLLVDNPDLSGVATDGSAALWIASSSGRRWSKITAVNNTAGVKTVTVADAYANTESGKGWGIGGKRATLDGSTQLGLDIRAGWTIDVQANDTLTATFRIAPNVVAQTPAFFTSTATTAGQTPTTTLTTSSATLGCVDLGGANNLQISNLYFKCTNVAPSIDGLSPKTTGDAVDITITDCVIDGFRIGLRQNDAGLNNRMSSVVCSRLEVKNCTSAGISQQIASGLHLSNCYIHGNAAGGLDWPQAQLYCANTIFDGNAGGFNVRTQLGNISQSFVNCVFSNATTGNGLDITTNNTGVLLVKNCIFWSNPGYGFAGNAPNACLNENNAYGSNTSGARQNVPAGHGDVALTANPFVSATDFGLNSTAGGGAACKGAAATNLGSANAAGDIGAIPSGGGAAAATAAPTGGMNIRGGYVN